MTLTTRTTPAGEPRDAASANAVDSSEVRRVVRADVDRLFRAYNGVLALVLDPPASVKIPPRLPGDRLINRTLMKLRPSFARSTFLVRHIRRNVQVIERAYCRRLATGQHDDNDEQELELVRRFEQSLPPAPARWVAPSLTIAGVLLAQALLSAWDSAWSGRYKSDVLEIASFEPRPLYDAASAIVHADGLQLTGILLSLSLAVYVVLRAPVSGFHFARMLLNEPRALAWRNRGSALAHCARDLDVAGEEFRLFTNLRQPRRRDPPLDLLVKAAIAGSLWFGFVYALTRHNTDALGIAAVSPFALRLLWLAAEGFRRGQWVALGAGILVVSAVASIAPDFGDVYAPYLPPGHTARSRIEHSQSLAFTASALEQASSSSRHVLRGIDLRGRRLNSLHLSQIDLKGAQLTNANLAYIDLSQSCLADAVMRGVNFAGADLLGADVRGADLTGANLHGAKLAGAGYDGQTVWPEGYPGRSGARPVAPAARSRCEGTTELDLPGWAEGP
jgi:hypothetical protein